MATQITNARVFYKTEAEVLPVTGNIVGDLYKDTDGQFREWSYGLSGFFQRGTLNGAASVTTLKLANEENPGTANAYGTGLRKWRELDFNPRADSIGTLVGAAGALGTTEVLVDAGVPILVGAIVFESDSIGNALLRNTGAVGNSVIANQVSVNSDLGFEFAQGLTLCGTATSVAFKLLYRAL